MMKKISAIMGVLVVALGVSMATPASAKRDECFQFRGSWALLNSGSHYIFANGGMLHFTPAAHTPGNAIPIGWECNYSKSIEIHWNNGTKCRVSVTSRAGGRMFTEWHGYYCPHRGPHIFQRD
jgi:hypothetical protein